MTSFLFFYHVKLNLGMTNL